jgi:hypothetical protein
MPSHLSCNIGIVFTITITVIGIDVVRTKNTIHRLQYDSGMVISYHIGISILWLVYLHIGMVPCKLLAWFNRLKADKKLFYCF